MSKMITLTICCQNTNKKCKNIQRSIQILKNNLNLNKQKWLNFKIPKDHKDHKDLWVVDKIINNKKININQENRLNIRIAHKNN
jgi:hypothetical protein